MSPSLHAYSRVYGFGHLLDRDKLEKMQARVSMLYYTVTFATGTKRDVV